MGEQAVFGVEEFGLGEGGAAAPVEGRPTARTVPVSPVIGRSNFGLRSSEAQPMPAGRTDCTAQSAAESSRVA
jgi:hypothetical protein